MAARRSRIFWLIFWANVAIVAALVWSIREYRNAFTYRMDVLRVPSLENAVDAVNDAEEDPDAAVGVTEDAFIQLGTAADAGLAEIGRRGDVAVFMRPDDVRGGAVIELYVTPNSRYVLSRWPSPADAAKGPKMLGSSIYAMAGGSDTLGTIRVPSGEFQSFELDGRGASARTVSGVDAFLPVEGGNVFMLRGGCDQRDAGTGVCNLDMFDGTAFTIRTLVTGIDIARFGTLFIHSYDASVGAIRLVGVSGDPSRGALTELSVDGASGEAEIVASYAREGVCDPAGNDNAKECTEAMFSVSSSYWHRVRQLGLQGANSSERICGALVIPYDVRRGEFLGCISYDPELFRAVQSGPVE